MTAPPIDGCCVTFIAMLRHQSVVNAVRFSPNGRYIASADDDGTILVWARQDAPDHDADVRGAEAGSSAPAGASAAAAAGAAPAGATTGAVSLVEESEDLEQWRMVGRVRPHQSDVMDLAWSPDSTRLLSGSVDNTAVIWDIRGGKRISQQFRDHNGYVQGVAWCPRGRTQLLTQSADRSVRVYEPSKRSKGKGEGKLNCVARITSLTLPNQKPAAAAAAAEAPGDATAATVTPAGGAPKQQPSKVGSSN
jgi:chromatin assembly factor 1 subunit B